MSNLKIFKCFYSNLAGNLLTNAPSRYTIKILFDYQQKLSLSEIFKLNLKPKCYLFKLLKKDKVTKAAGIYKISGKLLKDVARILAKPISKLCNLSMTLRSFPDVCKIVKVKQLFKVLFRVLPVLPKVFERVALCSNKIILKKF